MGYLYLKYGIHIAIAFHFLLDYMSVPSAMNSGIHITFNVLSNILIIAGVILTVYYLILISQKGKLKEDGKIKNL